MEDMFQRIIGKQGALTREANGTWAFILGRKPNLRESEVDGLLLSVGETHAVFRTMIVGAKHRVQLVPRALFHVVYYVADDKLTDLQGYNAHAG